MAERKSPSGDKYAKLRREAEKLTRQRPREAKKLTLKELQSVVHELQVHQIELEMQNEELRRAQSELETARDRYADLYDFAPVGFLTIDETHRIREANLTAAALLGAGRARLLHRPLTRYIFKESQDGYHLYSKSLFATLEPQECELRLVKEGGEIFYAQLTGTAAAGADGAKIARISLSDVSERKKAAEEMRRLNETLEQRVIERTAELKKSHAQLKALSRQLLEAQEQERRAIGIELHDEIGQTLTALRILIQVAQRPPLEAHIKQLEQSQRILGELIDRVSALSLDLRPPMLDDMGVLPALFWFIERYESRTGIAVDFQHGGLEGRRFVSTVETTVYRLVQEGLTNVARHAGVQKAGVRVESSQDGIDISITDMGAGFDVPFVMDKKDAGGLSGMRERARLLDGEIEIASAPGRGTRIGIRIPLLKEPGSAGTSSNREIKR